MKRGSISARPTIRSATRSPTRAVTVLRRLEAALNGLAARIVGAMGDPVPQPASRTDWSARLSPLSTGKGAVPVGFSPDAGDELRGRWTTRATRDCGGRHAGPPADRGPEPSVAPPTFFPFGGEKPPQWCGAALVPQANQLKLAHGGRRHRMDSLPGTHNRLLVMVLEQQRRASPVRRRRAPSSCSRHMVVLHHGRVWHLWKRPPKTEAMRSALRGRRWK